MALLFCPLAVPPLFVITRLDRAQGLALAFERMARSVRLTLALENRLARERRLDRAEACELRKKQVRAAVTTTIRAETSGMQRFDLERELDERLAEDALYAAFTEGPVETRIARLRDKLGLPAQDPAKDPEPEVLDPSPLAGEGGLRSRSDEGWQARAASNTS